MCDEYEFDFDDPLAPEHYLTEFLNFNSPSNDQQNSPEEELEAGYESDERVLTNEDDDIVIDCSYESGSIIDYNEYNNGSTNVNNPIEIIEEDILPHAHLTTKRQHDDDDYIDNDDDDDIDNDDDDLKVLLKTWNIVHVYENFKG